MAENKRIPDELEQAIQLQKVVVNRMDKDIDEMSLDQNASMESSLMAISTLITRIKEFKEGNRSEDLIKLDAINAFEAAFNHGFNSGIAALQEQLLEQGIHEIKKDTNG